MLMYSLAILDRLNLSKLVIKSPSKHSYCFVVSGEMAEESGKIF